jgi:hypothetical protein
MWSLNEDHQSNDFHHFMQIIMEADQLNEASIWNYISLAF